MLEILWLIFTFILIWVVMLPIFNEVPAFPFKWENALFIAVFITLFRYIFFLKHSWLYRNKYAQVFFMLAGISLVVILMRILNNFTLFLDDSGIVSVLGNLPYRRQIWLISYIKTEFLLFGLGSIIAAIILPIRLLVAFWRNINK